MTTMPECQVKDCSTPIEGVWNPFEDKHGYPRIDLLICEFHKTAFRSGEDYMESLDDDRIILTGQDLPREVVSFEVLERGVASMPVVTLILGRDGIEEDRLTVRFDAERASMMSDWLTTVSRRGTAS